MFDDSGIQFIIAVVSTLAAFIITPILFGKHFFIALCITGPISFILFIIYLFFQD